MWGKNSPKFGEELGCEGLVVRQHEGRPLQLLDDVRHGERLSRACDPPQHLVALSRANAADQRLNRLRLIAGGLKIADQLELGHTQSISNRPASSPQ